MRIAVQAELLQRLHLITPHYRILVLNEPDMDTMRATLLTPRRKPVSQRKRAIQ